MEAKKSPKSSTAGDSDIETEREMQSAMHSAATTQPSSPRVVTDVFAPCTDQSPPWQHVRQRLYQMALDGDEAVGHYGDIISDKAAVERFLSGSKGDVEKAVLQMKQHLHWRREFNLEQIIDEDFSDVKAHGELYWGGTDRNGVPTLTWLLRKHDANKTRAERFVRFLIYNIERGMRASPSYPNTPFNIIVDLSDVGFGNNDPEMAGLLQKTLVENYPKVRKSLYVFPVNWFVHLFWDTIIKPILSTLQPDIEDKICPLRGDYEAELLQRFTADEIEVAFGGTLDVAARGEPTALPYEPTSVRSMLQPRPSPLQQLASEVDAVRNASPSATTRKAAQKLVREEQRSRRMEAHARHLEVVRSEQKAAALPQAAKASKGQRDCKGRREKQRASWLWALCSSQAWFAFVMVWCAYVLCAEPDATHVRRGMEVVVASGLALATKALVGEVARKGRGGEDRNEGVAVERMRLERRLMFGSGGQRAQRADEGGRTSLLSRYAQVCGF